MARVLQIKDKTEFRSQKYQQGFDWTRVDMSSPPTIRPPVACSNPEQLRATGCWARRWFPSCEMPLAQFVVDLKV